MPIAEGPLVAVLGLQRRTDATTNWLGSVGMHHHHVQSERRRHALH